MLKIFDFDGTVALTFEPSPNNVGVTEAYRRSVADVFGNTTFDAYERQGGLRNRSPSELVIDLFEEVGERLIERAQSWLSANDQQPLRDKLDWSTGNGLAAASEVLVQRKLDLLVAEVGQPMGNGEYWPRCAPGFPEFWRRISNCPNTRTLILSSGHTAFIGKFFALHGLSQPDAVFTDDDVRHMPTPVYKPDPRLLYMALARLVSVARYESSDWQDMVLFGDDPVKDGGLAEAADIPFFQFVPPDANSADDDRAFTDWRQAIPLLDQRLVSYINSQRTVKGEST
ncbi:MAG: HAD family hydrolase [Gammaproteobacteria bacterium]|nr:HAD family hydrolase [Gammaproteobacteria bacterium]